MFFVEWRNISTYSFIIIVQKSFWNFFGASFKLNVNEMKDALMLCHALCLWIFIIFLHPPRTDKDKIHVMSQAYPTAAHCAITIFSCRYFSIFPYCFSTFCVRNNSFCNEQTVLAGRFLQVDHADTHFNFLCLCHTALKIFCFQFRSKNNDPIRTGMCTVKIHLEASHQNKGSLWLSRSTHNRHIRYSHAC